MLPLISTSFEITRASSLVYANSDLSPPGAPDKLIDPNEYLTANPTLLDQVTATSPTMFHGNAYPVGASETVLVSCTMVGRVTSMKQSVGMVVKRKHHNQPTKVCLHQISRH